MALTIQIILILAILIFFRNQDAKVVGIALVTLLCMGIAHLEQEAKKQENVRMQLRSLDQDWNRPTLKM